MWLAFEIARNQRVYAMDQQSRGTYERQLCCEGQLEIQECSQGHHPLEVGGVPVCHKAIG
jgi:hypothetical protein